MAFYLLVIFIPLFKLNANRLIKLLSDSLNSGARIFSASAKSILCLSA